MNHETGYVQVDDGELYYEVAGNGPALVFIHAGIANCRMWDNQIAHFAPNYRVVRYDARGFGRTKTKPINVSNRQDVISLLDHLGIDQAVLIGNSRGGMIALDTALEFPDRVRGVVMLGSGPGGFTPDVYDPDEEAIDNQMMEAEERKAWDELVELEVQLWVDGFKQSAGRAPKAIRDLVASMIRQNQQTQEGLDELAPIPLKPNAWERRDEIKFPLLILIGTLDTPYCVDASNALAEAVPHAQKIVYEDTAHMLSLEHPERFNRDVETFLNRN